MTDRLVREISGSFLTAVHSNSPSADLTHGFYKYPARFSAEFARTAIHEFSRPGDLILDPFMGSGTTMVEAIALGRHALGSDISPLARFISEVKTTTLSEEDIYTLSTWAKNIQPQLNLRLPARRHQEWADRGYQKYLPWPIRKTIEFILYETDNLPTTKQQQLARCAILRTGQWALDCTTKFPPAAEFRIRFMQILEEYLQSVRKLRQAIATASNGQELRAICLNVPAAELYPALWETQINQKPNLIVTSPPYPSVHVLYHRWQIMGRRESPTPFWIAGELDGNGASYYTMGSRTPTGLNNYFRSIEASFSQMHSILAEGAFAVQLIAFSDIATQLPRYLEAMAQAGFEEVEFRISTEDPSARIWRQVPLRRWYASYKGTTSSSQELLLIHRRLP